MHLCQGLTPRSNEPMADRSFSNNRSINLRAVEREKESQGRQQAEERTSFTELLQHRHGLLSCQLRVS